MHSDAFRIFFNSLTFVWWATALIAAAQLAGRYAKNV